MIGMRNVYEIVSALTVVLAEEEGHAPFSHHVMNVGSSRHNASAFLGKNFRLDGTGLLNLFSQPTQRQ